MTIAESQTPPPSASPRNRSHTDRYLPFYLTASIVVHEALLLLFMGNPWLLSKVVPPQSKQIPIEFVQVPKTAHQSAPTETDRIGAYNSEAKPQVSEANSAQSDAPSAHQSTQEPVSRSEFTPTPERYQDSANYARSQIQPDQDNTGSPPAEVSPQTPPPAQAKSTVQRPSKSAPEANLAPLTSEDLFPTKAQGDRAASSPTTSLGHTGGSSGSSSKAPARSGGNAAALGTGRVGMDGNPYLYNNDRSGNGSGVDARQDLDLGPYLARLKSKIEAAWVPDTDTPYSKVILHFSILKDGSLNNLNIATSSGEPPVDQAAFRAVQVAADTFEPLPTGYKQEALHIEFTFTVRAGSSHSTLR